ncbi:MAG: dihydroneopterin triphosphate diphosphatase, partial [Rhodocyclaceae bacterium]|nr:dihydroneopterin triphosphate diphosphatase [Rhodocyclaceae bacterium]
MQAKRPVSILAVIHTPALEVLLLERVKPSQFWQSITGSQEDDESLAQTAVREIREETGFRIASRSLVDHRLSNRYLIPPAWRARYGAGKEC